MVIFDGQDERVCVRRHCHWQHGGEKGKLQIKRIALCLIDHRQYSISIKFVFKRQ